MAPFTMATGARAGKNVVQRRQFILRGNVHRPQIAAHAKLISKSPIPAFIPRDDLMDQLHRWCEMEVSARGPENFGIACKVDLHHRESVPWGFTVHMQRDGNTVSSIKMTFDDEATSKYAFIGRQENGMPEPQGDVTEVAGANFEMWKTDEAPVDGELREAIRSLCNGVAAALNRYYAFGSVFSEDL